MGIILGLIGIFFLVVVLFIGIVVIKFFFVGLGFMIMYILKFVFSILFWIIAGLVIIALIL